MRNRGRGRRAGRLIAAIGGVSASFAPARPLTDQLEAYYKLDGDLLDATANGRDLTPNGVPTYPTGKIGSGLGTASGGGSLSTSIAYTGASISLWGKFTSTAAALFIDQGLYTVGVRSFVIRLKRVTPCFTIACDGAERFSSSTLAADVWHHCVAVSDGAGNLKVYVNGVLEYDGANAPIPGTSDAINLNGTTRGSVDEVGIWSRALTAPEVLQLYNAGAGLAHPF